MSYTLFHFPRSENNQLSIIAMTTDNFAIKLISFLYIFHMCVKAMSHKAIFLATCNAMALHCKLQGQISSCDMALI